MKVFIINNKIQQFLTEAIDIDFSQFEIKDTLCPQIFNLETKMMIPEVRDKLLEIGFAFYEYIDIDPVEYDDLLLTGSLASYNWSEYSDLDLHLTISFSEISENQDIVDNMMWAMKSKFNEEHNILVNDFNVELYAQNSDDSNLVSNGIYSVKEDRWIKFPKKINLILDREKIAKSVNHFYERYQDIAYKAKNMKSGDNLEDILSQIDDLSDDIRLMRKRGLSSPRGEYSSLNLAYKMLRRLDVLNALRKLGSDVFDKKYSIQTFDVGQTTGLPRRYQDKLSSIKQKKIDMANSLYGGGETSASTMGTPYIDKSGSGLGGNVKKKASKYGVRGKMKYSIDGKKFSTLRQASAIMGIPKSTIEYRLKSNAPEWSNWRYI